MGYVENCCCCFSVKTGCYIIGYYNIIACSIGILTSLGLSIYGAILRFQPIDHYDKNSRMFRGNLFMTLGLACLVVLIIGLIISTIFVVGLHKKKRGFVKVFVICMIISLASAVLSALSSFVTLHPSTIITALIALGFQLHIYLVVKSHYDNMGEADEQITNKSKNDERV